MSVWVLEKSRHATSRGLCRRRPSSQSWKTGMTTEAQLRIPGLDVLIGAMGLIDAERYVAAINRDKCDYTK